jgi:hypothetical protein
MSAPNSNGAPPVRLPVPAAPTSTAQLQKNRENRSLEAIQMKDEQLRILTEQNSQLIRSLDTVEDQANSIQLEKLASEEENKGLRDKNFELQSRARSAEAAFKKLEQQVRNVVETIFKRRNHPLGGHSTTFRIDAATASVQHDGLELLQP